MYHSAQVIQRWETHSVEARKGEAHSGRRAGEGSGEGPEQTRGTAPP